jgi:hypothetical protein
VMYLQLSSMSYVSSMSCSAFNRSWKDCTGADTYGCLERLMWPLCTHCRTGGHQVQETSSRHSVSPPPHTHTTTPPPVIEALHTGQTQSNIVSSVYKYTTVQVGFKCGRNIWEDVQLFDGRRHGFRVVWEGNGPSRPMPTAQTTNQQRL